MFLSEQSPEDKARRNERRLERKGRGPERWAKLAFLIAVIGLIVLFFYLLQGV